MEATDQPYSGQDKNSPHDERAENSPKKHLVLLLGRHAEIPKDHQENEKIVYTEREFYDVAGHELQGHRAAMPKVNQHRKSGGQCHPHRAPAESFAEADCVRSPAEDP